MAEQDVADKRAQIRFFKASVVKNDGAVEKLLAQVVNVDCQHRGEDGFSSGRSQTRRELIYRAVASGVWGVDVVARRHKQGSKPRARGVRFKGLKTSVDGCFLGLSLVLC
eukprot:scaffold2947_cov118-Isochrysis_galbana.AAC.1